MLIRLDVLVNNAGCMVAARELTKEGLDRNWATAAMVLLSQYAEQSHKVHGRCLANTRL